MTILSSKLGEIKSEAEWQAECERFYKSVGMAPKWDTYVKLLGLQQPDTEREWSGRKPVNIKDSFITVVSKGDYKYE